MPETTPSERLIRVLQSLKTLDLGPVIGMGSVMVSQSLGKTKDPDAMADRVGQMMIALGMYVSNAEGTAEDVAVLLGQVIGNGGKHRA